MFVIPEVDVRAMTKCGLASQDNSVMFHVNVLVK